LKLITPLAVAAVLLLSACSTTPATPPVPVATVAAATDRTTDVVAVLGEDAAAAVESAEETEPGRITVHTSIVDPRTDTGSPEALLALSICAAVSNTGSWTHVNVMEADGTHFVLYGHPSAPDTCVEY